jgi:ATP-dependent DNA helicase DinG
VYWIEILPKERHTRIELHTAPVDVSSILKEEVFEKTKPIILTSATLTVNRSFKFIKERIGLEDSVELLLDSPFDYQNQALLYTEENLPDPSHELNEFKEKVIEKIKEIIEITKGRTFILFTSYELLQKANEILKQEFANMRIIAQGEAPKWQMIEEFKRGEIDILLGTNTFWQGIDVPGKALECVIIPKLPFLVPDDPLIEAKIEYIMNQQKDPFIHYTLPMAIIMLKQGFGRLIRTKTDYGVVAILDPRIKTRYYGRWFIESLPKCKIVNDVNEVKQFYEVIT